MKIINVLVLALVLSVSACNKKDKGGGGGDSGSPGTQNPPATGSTSGSTSGSGAANPAPEWDPDAEEGWGEFPDWGGDDEGASTTGGSSSGSVDSGAGSGSTSGTDSSGATGGSSEPDSSAGSSSGATSGSVDAGTTDGSATAGATASGGTSGSVDPGTTTGSSSTTGSVTGSSSSGSTDAGSSGGSVTTGSSSSGATSGSTDSSTTTGGSSTSTTAGDATAGSSDGGSTTAAGSTGGSSEPEVGGTTTTGGSTPAEDPLPAGYGYLSMKVTDAPFPLDWIEYAKVTLFKIEVRNLTTQSYIKAYDVPTEFDLLQLRNGITAALTKAMLPAGQYDQVRIFVTKGDIKLKDGRVFNLKVPSGESSGVKLLVSPAINVYEASESEMLLDIDLSKSFMPMGSSTNMAKVTNFKFSPVARASNSGVSGVIKGKVLNDNGTPLDPADDKPIAGATVRVAKSGQTIVSAITSAKGEYRIIGVPAQTYSVLFASLGYDSKEYGPITVSANVESEVTARLAKNPDAVDPLVLKVIKSQLVKGTTDIMAEVASFNGSVTLEATNGLQAKIVLIQGKTYIIVKSNSTGVGVVTVTDKKGQTSSFEIVQVAN